MQELNGAPVIPENFPGWTETMNSWGYKMIAATEVTHHLAWFSSLIMLFYACCLMLLCIQFFFFFFSGCSWNGCNWFWLAKGCIHIYYEAGYVFNISTWVIILESTCTFWLFSFSFFFLAYLIFSLTGND